ncbi:MAG: higA-2 [Phycisphaerales bacterium]|nr:higA-2 [Phycisphaerales bacterium]
MSKTKRQPDSFRKQMAQSMAALDSIMNAGQSFSGDNRLTVRTIRVVEPCSYSPGAVRAIRKRLGVSQAIFARLLGVSHVLVRSWERGARTPAAIARRLLDVIRDNPDALISLIRTAPPATARPTRKSISKGAASSRSRRASAA